MIGSASRSATLIHNCSGIGTVDTHLEVLSNFSDKALEGKLANEEFSGLLIPPDFTEGDGSGAESMGLLDTTSCSLDRIPSALDKVCSRVNSRLSCELRRTWRRAVYVGLCLEGVIVEQGDRSLGRGALTTSGFAGGLLSTGHGVECLCL
jgi:hypothetical protein